MVTRRAFLSLAVLGTATGVFPWVGCGDSLPRFLSEEERRALGVLADYVLPPDEAGPGGQGVGAVEFIEQLLTAMEHEPPRIFAGGPFSGRQPYPSPQGLPSESFPENQFKNFLPLTRVQRFAWRLRLYGSAGMPGGGPNDAVLSPVVGLRDLIRQGLAQAMQASSAPLETLDEADLEAVFGGLPQAFTEQLTELVLQATLSNPEYGGNRDLSGWRMVHFEGDILPLGYSAYDPVTGAYRDRPGAPVTAAAPYPDPAPMDAEVLGVLNAAVAVLGGKKFY